MRKVQPGLILANLALLVLVFMPLTFGLIGIIEMVRAKSPTVDREFAIGSLVLYSVIYAVPALLGGLLHQAAVTLLPARWSSQRMRLAAVLLSPIMLLGVALAGQPVQVLVWFAGPLLVGLVLFGYVSRLPEGGNRPVNQNGGSGITVPRGGTPT